MRATFINPRKRKARKGKRRKATRRKRSVPAALSRKLKSLSRKVSKMRISNPRRRTRRKSRSRRRNAGIVPFVGNPYILANPRRGGVRRRRNPGLGSPSFSPKTLIDKTVSYGGGAAIGTALNAFVLNGIKGDYLRNGARLAAAVIGGQMLRGEMGAAAAGATLYPMMIEVAAMLKLPLSTPEADLDSLAADLNDILSDDEYVW